VSGTEPQEPVVSKLSGHVFEKQLITKYLEANGKCPVTGEPLSPDDLVPLKVNKTVKPRPPSATSIPSLIQLFQNEWDALMLETFTLKEQLNTARQQLAHALYQQDAACRVIARLTRERDEARRALATAQAQQTVHAEVMDLETGAGISDQIKQNLISFSKRLTAERKQRTIPKETASEEEVKNYQVLSSHPTHSSSEPGILCLDIHPSNPALIVTGGVDKKAVVVNRESGVIETTLLAHSKKVSDVLFHPREDIIFTASYDKTVRMWKPSTVAGGPSSSSSSSSGGSNYTPVHTFRTHTREVVGLTLHPTGHYIASASADGSWAFHDLLTPRSLATFPAPSGDEGIYCTSFHPDGLLLGNGTDTGSLRIWDLKTLANVASFNEHRAKITSISFSENGFYLATVAEDKALKLWDLRKQKTVQTIDLDDPHLTSVSFDNSGKYLAAAGSNIRIFYFVDKLLAPLTTLAAHSALVTDVKFGPHCSFLASTSMDRTLKIWAPQ
jgi:pre-mRNA-processing factor 19